MHLEHPDVKKEAPSHATLGLEYGSRTKHLELYNFLYIPRSKYAKVFLTVDKSATAFRRYRFEMLAILASLVHLH